MGPRLESMELSHEQVTQLFQLAKARRVTDLDEPTVTMLQDELPTELKMCQDELLRAEETERDLRSYWQVEIEREMRQLKQDAHQLMLSSQSEALANPSADPATVLEHVEQLWAQLTQLLERSAEHALHRRLMDMPATKTAEVKQTLTERLEAQRGLWRAMLGWDRSRAEWMDAPLSR